MLQARFKPLIIAALTLGVFVKCLPAATVEAKLQNAASRTEAPHFALTDASGKTVHLADHQGKVVVLNFWATDCGGCRLEIPWLVDIDHDFKNKSVLVIGISMDISYEDLKNAGEAWARVNPFVASHEIKYSILMDDGEMSKHYDIQALPVTVLIDARGRIAATYVGLINQKNVEANINTLLAESN